jgi:catechol 2,3-dioxygenase-like lactoylglutathione lyase family enzyme
MQITSIAFTAYPAKDVPKLLAFYRDVMGLRVDRAHPNEQEAQLVEFDIGNDHWFTLLPEKMLERSAGSAGGIVFEVDDIDAMFDAVRPHAKTADEKVADYASCRMVSFEDPEGNKVSLHQEKK